MKRRRKVRNLPNLCRFFTQQALDKPSAYLLACSGGCDSMVLLDLLVREKAELSAPVTVCYINHGWHEAAEAWGRLVEKTAVAAGFAFMSQALCLAEKTENAARRARYQVFANLLPKNGVLLTAHHQNDQAETLLLNALRGSGVEGLSAMPFVKLFADGAHWRPLLGFSRRELSDYAQLHELDFIDDPSNANTKFTRNWLRAEVLPLLESRFPQAVARLAHSASLVGESRDFQTAMLDEILPSTITETLSLSLLKRYPRATQALLLRRWLARLAFPSLPERQLASLLDLLAVGRGEVHYARQVLLVHQGQLWALPFTEPTMPPPVTAVTLWQGIGRLTLHGLSLENLSWGLYPPSHAFKPQGKMQHKPLKEWFRLAGVPPYLRRRTPLLFRENKLIWVGDLGFADGQDDAQIQWQKYGNSDSITP